MFQASASSIRHSRTDSSEADSSSSSCSYSVTPAISRIGHNNNRYIEAIVRIMV
jgi:hypothetical protein